MAQALSGVVRGDLLYVGAETLNDAFPFYRVPVLFGVVRGDLLHVGAETSNNAYPLRY